MKRTLLLLLAIPLCACDLNGVWYDDSPTSSVAASSTTSTSTNTNGANGNPNLASFIQLTSGAYNTPRHPILNKAGTKVLYHDGVLKIMNTDGTGELILSSTSSSGDTVYNFDFSADGSVVVFSGKGNQDGTYATTPKIYVTDADGSAIQAIAAGTGAHITADATKVAFVSNGDPLGTNGDGSYEIYTISPDGSGLAQVTDFPADTIILEIAMSKDGSTFVLETNADLSGGNSDGSVEMFVTDATASSFTQISSNTEQDKLAAVGGSLRISDDGQGLVFTSYQDLIGGNSAKVLVGYHIDLNLMQTRQIATVDTNGIAISGDNNWIYIASSDNLFGLNPDGERNFFKISSDVNSTDGYALSPGYKDFLYDRGTFINNMASNYDGSAFIVTADYDFIDEENPQQNDQMFFGITN